jgi:hypothetical protein
MPFGIDARPFALKEMKLYYDLVRFCLYQCSLSLSLSLVPSLFPSPTSSFPRFGVSHRSISTVEAEVGLESSGGSMEEQLQDLNLRDSLAKYKGESREYK